MQILILVRMQFARFTTSVTIMTAGMSVFALLQHLTAVIMVRYNEFECNYCNIVFISISVNLAIYKGVTKYFSTSVASVAGY